MIHQCQQGRVNYSNECGDIEQNKMSFNGNNPLGLYMHQNEGKNTESKTSGIALFLLDVINA